MNALRLAPVFIAVAVSLLLSPPANPAESPQRPFPVLKYGYPEQPPRAFTNSKGEADGYYPKLLRVLLSRAGIPWQSGSYPARRLMINLGTGEINFSILVKNPLLDKCCLYGSKPVWFDELRAYYISSKPPVRKKEDLVGKRIITLAGFSYGGLISFIEDPENRIENHPAQSHEAAFEMLDAGRADYVLDYAEPASAEGLAKHPVANLRSDVLDTVHMYFVLSRDYPNAHAVLDRLEAIYQKMREEDPKRELTR